MKLQHGSASKLAHRKKSASPRRCISCRKFIMVFVLVGLALYANFVVKDVVSKHPYNGDEADETNESTSEDIPQSEREESSETPRFVLYRLIGNNISPLQCYGQLLINTRYTLDHEPEFPDCKKLWVLNNIVNTTERALLLDLLISRGYTMDEIIIRRINYTMIAALTKKSRGIGVTAQNEARNDIIEDGIARGARWILAFDGNQFYTNEAWKAIVAAADRHEQRDLKYFKVPMYRLYTHQNPKWLHGNSEFRYIKKYAPVLWESQFAFRNDSDARYSEGIQYGRDNKLELMDRICGTGRFDPQSPPENDPADTGQCGCHREVGCDRKQRAVNESVPAMCGYSIRLWYHPCKGVNASRIFVDRAYRASLRDQGHKELEVQIEKETRMLQSSPV